MSSLGTLALLCPQVGCGVTSYREGAWYSTLYTCNYGPNGETATLVNMTITIDHDYHHHPGPR